MVSNISINFMTLALAVSSLFPVFLYIYFFRKYKISLRPVLIGALVFILFTQLFEKLLHSYVLGTNLFGIVQKPFILGIYGAFAAGIFEEVGKFIGMKYWMKNKTQWKDGIAYGIGHGGIESILVGGLSFVQSIIFANLINTGMLERTLSSKIPLATLAQLKNTLVNTPYYMFAISPIERIMAVALQIGLSLIVLYGIKNKKYIYLLWAILLHALFDLLPGLYQALKFNVWIAEGVIFIFAAISVFYIQKSKKFFDNQNIS